MTIDGDERVILRIMNSQTVSVVFDTMCVEIKCIDGKVFTSVEQYDSYDSSDEDEESSTADESVTLGSVDTDMRDIPNVIQGVDAWAGGSFDDINEEHEWQTQLGDMQNSIVSDVSDMTD